MTKSILSHVTFTYNYTIIIFRLIFTYIHIIIHITGTHNIILYYIILYYIILYSPDIIYNNYNTLYCAYNICDYPIIEVFFHIYIYSEFK